MQNILNCMQKRERCRFFPAYKHTLADFFVFLYLQRLEAKQCVLENNQIDFLFVTWARDSEELRYC